MSLYQHKNLRDMTAEEVRLIINSKRDQRLITAIEAQTARAKKITKLSAKDQERYGKIGDKLATRLAKISEMLDMCDADLNQMQSLSNNLDLYDQELGVSSDEE